MQGFPNSTTLFCDMSFPLVSCILTECMRISNCRLRFSCVFLQVITKNICLPPDDFKSLYDIFSKKHFHSPVTQGQNNRKRSANSLPYNNYALCIMNYALKKGSTQWHEQPPSRRSRSHFSIHNSLYTNKTYRSLSARRRGILVYSVYSVDSSLVSIGVHSWFSIM